MANSPVVTNKPCQKTYDRSILPKGFKYASLNINGLLTHIDELRVLLNNLQFDVLAINETKLDSTISNGLINVDGYNIERKDRTVNGGGVSFYIKNSINYIMRTELISDELEMIAIEILKPNAKPFILATWYRPQNTPVSLFLEFENFLKAADSEGKETLIAGDINCNLAEESTDPLSPKVKFLYEAYQFSQLIKEYTRVTPTSQTLIDHWLTNETRNISASGVIKTSISDHYLVYGVRRFPSFKSNPKYIETRDMKNYDPNLFRHDLKNAHWDLLNISDDPNDMLYSWEKLYLEVLDKHAPLRKRRVRNRPSPWLTPQVKNLMYRRDYLKRKYVKNGSTSLYNSYKLVRNEVNIAIRKAKQEYVAAEANKSIAEHNTHHSWRAINMLLGRKSKITGVNELKIDNTVFSDPDSISDAFNEYFTKVGPRTAGCIPETSVKPESYVKECHSVFQFTLISPGKVRNLLSKLSTSKACGIDGITPQVLKDSAGIISDTLCHILNRSLTTGIFFDSWKTAKVFPIHKGSAKTDPNNYRPISVLPILTKMFEKIVFDQLYLYLTQNDILTKFQSGFRSNHSTLTALLQATEKWLKNIDNSFLNGVVFMDLSKAFDTVDHNILLRKLDLYGVKEKAFDWFSSYLRNRLQCCVVNNTLSEPKTMLTGVPQGSTLGPLLFLIYVNDLPNCLECYNSRHVR